MSAPRIEVLTDELRGAFVNALRPATVDEVGMVSENEAFGTLVGRHWHAVPVEALARLRHSSASFYEAGFRYYAPARLMFALFDSDTAWDVLEHVTSGARTASFWPREQRAVRRFLEFVCAAYPWEPDAPLALAEYTERCAVSAWALRREELGLQSIAAFAWQPNEWTASELPALARGELGRVVDAVLDAGGVEWPRLLHSLLSDRAPPWIAMEATRGRAVERIDERLTDAQRRVSHEILAHVASGATAGRG